MDAGLTPFLLAKWVFVILAFVFVLLVARSLPQGHLVIKMAGAVATVNPEKLAELATEPGALSAFGRLLPPLRGFRRVGDLCHLASSYHK
jgi:hypothetical protein